MSVLNPSSMLYRNFGSSGLKISAISLGTAIFNKPEQLETNQQTVAAALKLGVNYFDTSEFYGAGQAEIQLGTILKKLKVPR
jgi:aryl-alcohol dehydrogenase-like predicted oxidoreductase